jgi:hypothetical protein
MEWGRSAHGTHGIHGRRDRKRGKAEGPAKHTKDTKSGNEMEGAVEHSDYREIRRGGSSRGNLEVRKRRGGFYHETHERHEVGGREA